MTTEKLQFFRKYDDLLRREDRDSWYDDYQFDHHFLNITPDDEAEWEKVKETEVCF